MIGPTFVNFTFEWYFTLSVCHPVHQRYVWGREHGLELICIGYFMLTC